jgi:hypothetical protein
MCLSVVYFGFFQPSVRKFTFKNAAPKLNGVSGLSFILLPSNKFLLLLVHIFHILVIPLVVPANFLPVVMIKTFCVMLSDNKVVST